MQVRSSASGHSVVLCDARNPSRNNWVVSAEDIRDRVQTGCEDCLLDDDLNRLGSRVLGELETRGGIQFDFLKQGAFSWHMK